MPRRYNLPLSLQKLVRAMVAAVGNDPTPLCFYGYGGSHVSFPDREGEHPVSVAELRLLESAGLLAVGAFSTGNTASVILKTAAFEAVNNNFGLRKRDVVLRAVYELGDADPEVWVSASRLVITTGLTAKEVSVACSLLIDADLITQALHLFLEPPFAVTGVGDEITSRSPPIEAPPRPEPENEYAILPGGIEAVEHPDADAPHGSTIVHAHQVGAVNSGAYASANVTQNIGANIGEIVEAINAARAHVSELPEDDQAEVAEALDDLEQEAKTTRKPSRMKAFLGTLASKTNKVAGFTATVLTIAEKTGLKEFVEKLIHRH